MAKSKDELIKEAQDRGVALSGDETVAELKDKLANAPEPNKADAPVQAPVADDPQLRKEAAEGAEIARARAGQAAAEAQAKNFPLRDAEDATKRAEEAARSVSGEPVIVKFRDHKGEVQERQFSHDAHGDKYLELAEDFKRKFASRLVK